VKRTVPLSEKLISMLMKETVKFIEVSKDILSAEAIYIYFLIHIHYRMESQISVLG
jgi:hypothetical protein